MTPDQKDLRDWTFDELVSHACWKVIEGMTKGQSLRDTMFSVVNMATAWARTK